MSVSQLQQLIENSTLSETDKDMWLHTMEILDDEHADAILDVVRDDPHELDVMTRNLKLKQIAFADGDENLLNQILDEEKENLSRV
jgi:hypothetical protein